ncbi:hypothetical protein CROQUDRAFT_104134 [Cronartium quercuum f. sp. fusiforme G11]|uniref:Uncharacterized protein n=1 Tax=Cronartium quercuum f. sp. fusiforme G11 TaxID=708437 RepID=A0A9P6NRA0_9BASI|nr:hypothetical protein CROQUDRAFT_104134 [Cronartium quercuum f. sp. fusiforme G11]
MSLYNTGEMIQFTNSNLSHSSSLGVVRAQKSLSVAVSIVENEDQIKSLNLLQSMAHRSFLNRNKTLDTIVEQSIGVSDRFGRSRSPPLDASICVFQVTIAVSLWAYCGSHINYDKSDPKSNTMSSFGPTGFILHTTTVALTTANAFSPFDFEGVRAPVRVVLSMRELIEVCRQLTSDYSRRLSCCGPRSFTRGRVSV